VFAELCAESPDDVSLPMALGHARSEVGLQDAALAALDESVALAKRLRDPEARVVADYIDDHNPRREAGWIAEAGGEPVGSVLCVAKDERTARLRLLLVEPAARGAGYEELTLWTNSVLTAARRVYARAGFAIVDSKPHRSFGRDLQDETWALVL
jgi:GNAT superfamily N-acetyltransferase